MLSRDTRRQPRLFHCEKTALKGYLLLPGLINAHDHLEFGLFPRLGRRIYADATEWARDIYHPKESPVKEHLSLSKRTRLIWGGLRNLLCGVTTVAHHNPYHAEVFDSGFPVRVVRRFGWAHSLAFSADALERYRRTPPGEPFIIHAGEGTNHAARAELRELDRLGMLGSRTVVVHGLALDDDWREVAKARSASIVWCPSSNLLTYGRTLPRNCVENGIPVALGTDSPISAAGDMIDEIRIAHLDCGVLLKVLYSMLTDQARRILRLRPTADFIAVRDRGQTPAQALLDLPPELVVIGGRIHLISESLRRRFKPEATSGFHRIAIEGRGEWLTPFDVPGLLREARDVLGIDVRLGGKRVTS